MKRLLARFQREPEELRDLRRYSAEVLERANDALVRARERMDDLYDERRRGRRGAVK